MSKLCSKCNKTVYPLEELKCLDRIWHKACFKCEECGMTLNMKNYKGYDKKPYCSAHYPETKYTAVAETPEMKRIAENTKLQSQIQYHQDFERDKGKKISVATDPELERLKINAKVISNIEYHKVLEKKEQMEQKRRGSDDEDDVPAPRSSFSVPSGAPAATPQAAGVANAAANTYRSPMSGKNQPTTIYAQGQPVKAAGAGTRQPGSIFDYDPQERQSAAANQQVRSQSTLSDTPQAWNNDRVRGSVNSVEATRTSAAPVPEAQRASASSVNAAPTRPTAVYRALYDYEAQDEDEVSFVEDDVVTSCQFVDENWMIGTIQRTRKTGMLPANYVEPTAAP